MNNELELHSFRDHINALANVKSDIDLHIENSKLNNAPIRLYYPDKKQNLYPTLMYVHGAGWIAGSLDTHDNICRHFAKHAGCLVIACDYRLAPEHPFPAPLDDVFSIYQTLRSTSDLPIDQDHFGIAGDSAGGQLCAALVNCLKTNNLTLPNFMLLSCPALDLESFASDEMRFFINNYIPENLDRKNPEISPLFATDFSNMPALFMNVAENDALKNDGLAYAEKVKAAGGEVEIFETPNQGHLAGKWATANHKINTTLKTVTDYIKRHCGT